MWTLRSNGLGLHAIGSSQVLAGCCGVVIAQTSSYTSAAAGDTAALRALWARGVFVAFDGLGCVAAAGDHLDTLQWLFAHGVGFDVLDVFAAAAAGGATAVLQWLWDSVRQVKGGEEALLSEIAGTVKRGALTRATEDTRTLEWLRAEGLGPRVTFAAEDAALAAAAGNVGALRWLHEETGPLSDLSAARAAAAGGHLGALAYLRKAGPPFDGSVADAAIESSDACHGAVRDASREETERWLREEAGCVTRRARGCPRAEEAGDKAAGAKAAGAKAAGAKAAGDKAAGDKRAGDKAAGDKRAWDWFPCLARSSIEALRRPLLPREL